jgi:hypothetical protein
MIFIDNPLWINGKDPYEYRQAIEMDIILDRELQLQLHLQQILAPIDAAVGTKASLQCVLEAFWASRQVQKLMKDDPELMFLDELAGSSLYSLALIRMKQVDHYLWSMSNQHSYHELAECSMVTEKSSKKLDTVEKKIIDLDEFLLDLKDTLYELDLLEKSDLHSVVDSPTAELHVLRPRLISSGSNNSSKTLFSEEDSGGAVVWPTYSRPESASSSEATVSEIGLVDENISDRKGNSRDIYN